MKRKTFLPQIAVSSSVFLTKDVLKFLSHDFARVRVPRVQQKRTNPAIEKAIIDFIFKVVKKELRKPFKNCFLNR